MISRLFHALLAASVVAGAAALGSYGVSHWVPEGKTHDRLERWFSAGGKALEARLPQNWKDRLSAAKERLPQVEDTIVGEMPQAAAPAQKLFHLYNIGAWTAAGFILCFVMTVLFAVSSLKSALALGFKVALTLIFLQAALIAAGVLF